MTFREEMLAMLEGELHISPKTVAENMAQVIRGETVRKDFDGKGELTKKSVVVRPEDALKGAMIYDALRGGDLGLAPKSMIASSGKKSAEVIHRRLKVDTRIIANFDDIADGEQELPLESFLDESSD